jgi:hypothetical protein
LWSVLLDDLWFCFHNVGQCRVPWLVQSQISAAWMEQTTVESQTLSSPIRYSDKTHSRLPPCKKKLKKIPTPTQKIDSSGLCKDKWHH